MTFTAPLALLLLLVLPLVWWIGRPAHPRGLRRAIVGGALRSLLLVCLILALAGAHLTRSADRLAVVFLVDASDSMSGSARGDAYAYIRDAVQAMGVDDQAAVVLFGRDALIDRPMGASRDLAPFRSTPDGGASDLERAIGLGLALLPGDAAGRIVLLSDGEQTTGDAEAAARRAGLSGVPIHVIAYPRDDAPDARVVEVRTPSVVGAGQAFDVVVDVESSIPTTARLRLFAGGTLVEERDIALRAGVTRHTVSLTAGGERGFGDFTAQIELPAADAFAQNNRLSAFTRVVGAPRVLLISRADAPAPLLVTALEAVGIAVETATPGSAPRTLAGLAGYDAVIVNDVSAAALSPGRMQALAGYVRDLGGGLVVIGGAESYAPGGYYDTPLEAALPVTMRLEDQQRIPQVTIAYVIDRSGSMMMTAPSGFTNLELAQAAIIRSIDFLQPTDRAGVVSFDTAGYWVAEIQPVADRTTLQLLVSSLLPGGGTDIMAGYSLASEAMIEDPSVRRHILILTDGISSERGLIELATQLNSEHDITTSIIAIGGSPGFLPGMAAAGGGNYHRITDTDTIPAIFAEEAAFAAREYYVEGEIIAEGGIPHPILSGIDALPMLRGYVATTLKRGVAQALLTASGGYDDPLLAAWQYGLGRAVAFTSDAVPRWSAEWVAWDGFPVFWGQTVRWTIGAGTRETLETRITADDDGLARVVVEARDDAGDFANGLTLDALVTAPDGGAQRLTLRQVAPGRYEAAFVPRIEGAYFARALTSDGELSPLGGWVRRYSAEYDARRPSVLPAIAAASGGEADIDPRLVFDRRALPVAAEVPLAPSLLLIALLLLPLDIAARRLLVTQSDLARLGAALSPRPRAAAAPADARLSALLGAKARAGDARSVEPPVVPTAPLPEANLAPPLAGADAPTQQEGGTLAGRLLQRRRPPGSSE
jgi:uncharacterized membrane protein